MADAEAVVMAVGMAVVGSAAAAVAAVVPVAELRVRVAVGGVLVVPACNVTRAAAAVTTM